jgi:hypothetical protein
VTLSSAASRAFTFGVLLGTCGAACGGSSSGSGGTVADTPFDLPIAISAGGPVLAAPRVQPIYFPGFPYQTDIDTFLARLPASSYWPAVVAEYGVGAPTVLPGHVSSVPAGATIVSTDIGSLFAQVMNADAAALGPPDGDTIYPLFFPASTTITSSGQPFCGTGAPSGFHTEWSVGGTSIAGVVIPFCTASADDPSLHGVQALTPTVSHELVEAATDPFPTSAPAFIDVDQRHLMWSIAVSGGEVADLCENESPNVITPADLGFPVQRIWSNAAVRAGTGPCVPVPPGEIYVAAVATLPNQAPVKFNGVQFSVPTLIAADGAAATVAVTLRSVGDARASWLVGALEYHADSAAIPTAVAVSARNRQTVRVDVVPTGTGKGLFPLIIKSLVSSVEAHYWIGSIERR